MGLPSEGSEAGAPQDPQPWRLWGGAAGVALRRRKESQPQQVGLEEPPKETPGTLSEGTEGRRPTFWDAYAGGEGRSMAWREGRQVLTAVGSAQDPLSILKNQFRIPSQA